MKRWLFLAVYLGARCVAAPMPQARDLSTRALPSEDKRFALVIGVDEYQDPQIRSLSGASNDARVLSEALVEHAGFSRDRVIRLASDQPADRMPTRGNILRRLSNLKTVVPSDGLLLVSFSGHGVERGGRGFILPADAQLSGDISLLEDTAIGVSVLSDRIRQIGAKQVMFVVDACRNDPLPGKGGGDNRMSRTLMQSFDFAAQNRNIQAFAVLFAAAVGSRAFESAEQQMGYFTWALADGMSGAAANGRGEVTLGALIQYVQRTVPRKTAIDLGVEQQPFAIVEGYLADSLVIAAGGRRTSNQERPPVRQRPPTGGGSTEQSGPKPSSPPISQAAEGRLVVSADRSTSVAAVRLVFDSGQEVMVRTGDAREAAVPPGQHMVQCFATSDGSQWVPIGNPARLDVAAPPLTTQVLIVQPIFSNGVARWNGMMVSSGR
jgi:hypothetical protein